MKKIILSLIISVFLINLAGAEILHDAPEQALVDEEITVNIDVVENVFFQVNVYEHGTTKDICTNDPARHSEDNEVHMECIWLVDELGEKQYDIVAWNVIDDVLEQTTFTIEFIEELPNNPPVINSADATATEGEAPLEVSFTADVEDADGDELTYLWQFGNGDTSDKENTTYTYTEPGQYFANLTVDDGQSGLLHEVVISENILITVRAPAPPVVAGITSDFETGGSTYVQFWSAVGGGAGGYYKYAWDFGDGETSEVANPAHRFSKGLYTVTLTAEDENGKTGKSNSILINTAGVQDRKSSVRGGGSTKTYSSASSAEQQITSQPEKQVTYTGGAVKIAPAQTTQAGSGIAILIGANLILLGLCAFIGRRLFIRSRP